jgi:triacylglycerol lipase
VLQALLIVVIGAEIAGYIWLADSLLSRGWQGVSILLLIIFIAFCWRLSHATGSAMVSGIMRLRHGRRDRGMWQAFIGEFSSRLTSFNFSQPFHQLAMPREPLIQSTQIPILLVHGYFSNRGMWVRFRQRLAALTSAPIFTLTFEPPFDEINTFAKQLHKRIEEILQATEQSKVIIIAHSMGGLVTRQYMVDHGAHRIQQFISIGTPHQGTRLAYYGIGKCTRQMWWRGEWLNALVEKEKSQSKPATLSIYTTNDDIVYPPESSRLDWATNVAVNHVGHVGLLFSAEVVGKVNGYLTADARR